MRECLSAVHRQGEVLKLTLVSCVLMVAFYAVLIPLFGITGAVCAGLARELVMFCFWARPFRREFGAPFPVRDLVRTTSALALLALPLVWVGASHGPLGVIAAAALGGGLYLITVVAVGLISVKSMPLPRVLVRR
jgi:O-antigen/teichoic acid export membrane protein